MLSQVVGLAGSTNAHITAAVLGPAPDSYAASFDDVAQASVLAEDLAASLGPSAGMHNVLVHDYLEIDHEQVADAVPIAVELYGRYVRQVARWRADRHQDPILILFDGGMGIGVRRLRVALAPVLLVGVVGTLLTAGAVALLAHLLFDLPWLLALLLGTALAPTAPAAVYSVLGNREVRGGPV